MDVQSFLSLEYGHENFRVLSELNTQVFVIRLLYLVNFTGGLSTSYQLFVLEVLEIRLIILLKDF